MLGINGFGQSFHGTCDQQQTLSLVQPGNVMYSSLSDEKHEPQVR